MREAYHVIDKVIELLPLTVSKKEVQHFKQLANKGIYQCPYCHAELIVKYGEEREIHFSHRHSEACMESKAADKAEKKYRKQVERESIRHKTLIEFFIDELKITSKINPDVHVDYGYRVKKEFKHYPDIWLKISKSEIAISIVTNVNPTYDNSLSKEIKKRHSYFVDQGLRPVWFIENNELAIEKHKNAIVLWEAENSISLNTTEDKKWEEELKAIAADLSFFELYNYTPTMLELEIDVRSLYYVHSKNDSVTVSIHRFIKDRDKKPFRAFMLADYEIPFSKALVVNEGKLILSDDPIEESNRKWFVKRHKDLVKQKEEEERLRLEQEEQQRIEREKQKKLLREQMIEERKRQQQKEKVMSYEELKVLLRKRINLSQPEQQELWTMYMLRKIGAKNSQVVWDIVEKNDVKSFDELRRLL